MNCAHIAVGTGFSKLFTVVAPVMISWLTFLRLKFFEYRLFEDAAAAGELILDLLLLGILSVLVLFIAVAFRIDGCRRRTGSGRRG